MIKHIDSAKKFLGASFALFLFFPCLAQADVSTPRQLVDRPAAHCLAPNWSPDGQQLSYEVYHPKKDARETWIIKFSPGMRKARQDVEVNTGRGRARDLLGGGRKAPIVEFEWAPNMKLLSKPYVFSSVGLKRNFDLFADGSWLTRNSGNDGQPSWSPDGRYIAFTSQQKNSGDIMLLDLQGESEDPNQLTFWPSSTEFRPRWAPKKNYLLFTRSQANNEAQDIGLIADPSRPRETLKMVTNWKADEIRPSWSPDARKIAFYSNKEQKNDKTFDLWVINLNGSGALKLDTDIVVDDHNGPVWTPDGSTLLYVKKDFKRDNPIQWVRIDGSSKGELDTSTQLNSDLSLFNRGEQLYLAFKALGLRGSTEKTWERLYLVSFLQGDLSTEN